MIYQEPGEAVLKLIDKVVEIKYLKRGSLYLTNYKVSNSKIIINIRSSLNVILIKRMSFTQYIIAKSEPFL